jgi:ATP-dependent helicase IRC3
LTRWVCGETGNTGGIGGFYADVLQLSFLRSLPMMLEKTVEVNCSGIIQVAAGDCPRSLYEHQNQAMQALNRFGESPSAGLLVLPTGGGKTLTAVHWLLRNYVNHGKKVLWVAHRHELLNQAFETLKASAYRNLLSEREDFQYRIISGHGKHDQPCNIERSDDIIIASKDSLNTGLHYLLSEWVEHADEILVVIDEAHHATAKTYRKLITAIRSNLVDRGHAAGFQLLGLTATPFRTDASEQGLLKQVFPGDIVFSEHLRNLITRGILSEPVFEELAIKEGFTRKLTQKEMKTIASFDKLPPAIAKKIAESNVRNRQIVDQYLKHREKYCPMLLFAIDVDHAIALNELFSRAGVNSAYVVSSLRNSNGTTQSPEVNSKTIQDFRDGKLEVLINVEMLTEGTDLPNVQTVFLTRPTTSTILMTQMIGRALRGQKAGGTEKAYVVSCIDDWEDKINWVNPRQLHHSEEVEFDDRDTARLSQSIVRLIAIDKIEEFARIMDQSIDSAELEAIDFLQRIPVGIYRFSILEATEAEATGEEAVEAVEAEEPKNRYCEVLVYSDTAEPYDRMMRDLPLLVDIGDDEVLNTSGLADLLARVRQDYFPNAAQLLGYRDEDVQDVLRFYAQNETMPQFLAFEERQKCDLAAVARDVYDRDLSRSATVAYADTLWNDANAFWPVLFNDKKLYFWKQLNIEIDKLAGLYDDVPVSAPVVIPDVVSIERLTLQEIKEHYPDEYDRIVNYVYEQATDQYGFISCANSPRKLRDRGDFQIDHRIPMSEGGLTRLDNLQVLSKQAHREKTTDENRQRRLLSLE